MLKGGRPMIGNGSALWQVVGLCCIGLTVAAVAQTKQPKDVSKMAAVVRYQVTDVERSAAFYTNHLGFSLDLKSPGALAIVSRGGLALLLSGPGASGSRPMPG